MLYGNISPGGCIVKKSGVVPEMFKQGDPGMRELSIPAAMLVGMGGHTSCAGVLAAYRKMVESADKGCTWIFRD